MYLCKDDNQKLFYQVQHLMYVSCNESKNVAKGHLKNVQTVISYFLNDPK